MNNYEIHTYGEWSIIREATEESKGSKKRTCSVCGYEDIEEIDLLPHTHTYSDTWSIDEDYHWHQDTCGHSTISDMYVHTFENGICSVCGYVSLSIAYYADNTCGILGINKDFSGNLVIPTYYNGCLVTRIEEYAFSGCSKLTSISIPDSLTSISSNAFVNCDNMTFNKFDNGYYLGNENNPYLILFKAKSNDIYTCNINKDCKSINSCAFDNCNNLTSISIPSSVVNLGINCENLKTLYYDGTIEEWLNIKRYNSFMGLNDYNLECFYIKDENGTEQYNENKYSLLEDVVIPEGVNTIPSYAFYNCSSITSISIPSSVLKLDDCVFDGWSSLQSIFLSNGITSIGYMAFGDCSSLTSISLPDSIVSLGNNAFYGCSSLESVSLSNGITSIGKQTFIDCSSLTSISLPSSVVSIGYMAFGDCSSLTSISLPSSVVSFGTNSFYGCNSLTTLYYGGTIKDWLNIDNDSDSGSRPNDNVGFTYFYIKDNNGTVVYNGNRYSLLEEVVIPDDLTSIPSFAFSHWNSLTSISIPDGVVSLGNSAFYGCSSLESVSLSNGITSIGNNAFYGCSSLTSISLPSSVVSIGKHAFDSCSNLTNISLPSSVVSFGTNSFCGCNSLTTLYYGGTIKDWLNIDNDSYSGSRPNDNVGFTYFYIKDNNGTVVYNGNRYSLLEEVVIPDDITSIPSLAFSHWYTLTSISIPDSIINIGEKAFNSCSNLISNKYDNGNYLGNENNPYLILSYIGWDIKDITSININEKCKFIETYAFSNCSSLTSITIPDGVISIGSYAFEGCTNLTSISIPDSTVSIGEEAFNDCTNLEYNEYDNGYYLGNENNPYLVFVKGKSKNIESCDINEQCKLIYAYAFYNYYDLTSVIIPDSITNIGFWSFANCWHSVIYYKGTKLKWNNIILNDDISKTPYYYSETEPTDDSVMYWHYVDGVPTAW